MCWLYSVRKKWRSNEPRKFCKQSVGKDLLIIIIMSLQVPVNRYLVITKKSTEIPQRDNNVRSILHNMHVPNTKRVFETLAKGGKAVGNIAKKCKSNWMIHWRNCNIKNKIHAVWKSNCLCNNFSSLHTLRRLSRWFNIVINFFFKPIYLINFRLDTSETSKNVNRPINVLVSRI